MVTFWQARTAGLYQPLVSIYWAWTVSTTVVASDWRSSDCSNTNNIFHELFSQQWFYFTTVITTYTNIEQ